LDKRRTRCRLFLNGLRMLEGQDCDWYLDGDKVVIVGHCVGSRDVVIMEYNDFSEELLPASRLWHSCNDHGCTALIPVLERKCQACTVKSLERDISKAESERDIVQMKAEIAKLRHST